MDANQSLLSSAAQLGAAFALRADEIEQARRIPMDISQQMAAAGFYRLAVPAALGGLEAAPALSSQVFETLARYDASCAWVAFIGATSGSALSGVPATAAAQIFAHPETLVTGVFAPRGKAVKVEGGFRVSGRWQWGSGSQNAQWILGGCALSEAGAPMLDEQGRPRTHMALMPAADVELLDTWQVSGLCGSGSLDFQVTDLFVPDTHMVGYTQHDRVPVTPLYAFPNFTFLALGVGAVCLGIARAALDELIRLAQGKKRVGSRQTIAHKSTAQVKLAEAEAAWRSARLFYYDAIAQAWQEAVDGKRVSVARRRDVRLATTHAVNSCVRVVDEMYTLGGGSSVYRESRLQRHFRDIHVATQHIMVAPTTLETIGGHLFGLDANLATL